MKTSIPVSAATSGIKDQTAKSSLSTGLKQQAASANPLQLLETGIANQARFNPMQLLQSRQPSGTSAQTVIQKTAGTLHQVDAGSWEVTSVNGGFGPYTIANLTEVQPYLQDGNVVDYKNLGNETVWINSIGNQTFSKWLPPAKKQNTGSPIDLHHTIPNRLGLPVTGEKAPKDRPWLLGNRFKIDFGEELDPVEVDGQAEHRKLHKNSVRSGPFRGNSVSISWTLYYEKNGKIKSKDLPVNELRHGKSADFKEYTNIDLNDMYAIGRIISGGNKYNTKDSKQTAGGRYHSERDMVLQAERLPDFGALIAAAVTDKLGETSIPKLLMIHVHSHELRICEDCYQFLEAFMKGSWITTAKAAIKDGENMKISMLTSADFKHAVLSERTPPEAYEEDDTIAIADLPDILNMDVLREKKK